MGNGALVKSSPLHGVTSSFHLSFTTFFMEFSAKHTIGEQPKLDAYMSPSVTTDNYQHDIICQHK